MMKISTLSVVAATCIASTLCTQAQTKESPWTFGVKAGVSIPTNKNVDDHFLSLDLGGTVDYQLKNRFYLSSGLEFIGKGVRVSDKYTTTSTDGSKIIREGTQSSGDLIATFIQVPLTIGYRLPLSKNVNLTAKAGVYGAYKIHDGSEAFGGVNNFDYGLLGGIGIEYKRFSLNADYEFGLTNLRKQNNNYYISNCYASEPENNSELSKVTPSKWKNRNITISLGYKF